MWDTRHQLASGKNYNSLSARSNAFTIVELLVVIVVIGVLAAITIVSYSGISNRAIIASLQSDLSNASKQLKMFNVENGVYPVTISTDCAASPTTTTNLCLKPSSGNSYTTTPYVRATPQSFTLTATHGTIVYVITEDSGPVAYSAPSCPTGFIPVPGSATYGTDDFCVMKYEAKNVGGVATSQAALVPWANINLADSITAAAAACSGCHLITEAEYMTIAQNVLGVASNWSTGVVGSGFIYSGHNDTGPNYALEADVNDENGYANTNDTDGSTNRRTLTLSNGSVIWDLAGNVYEQTSDSVTTVKPGVTGGGYATREWTAVTNQGTLPINPSPAFTGVTGAGTWTSAKGMGRVFSNADNTDLGYLTHGGYWRDIGTAGIFALVIVPTNDASVYTGFRAAK